MIEASSVDGTLGLFERVAPDFRGQLLMPTRKTSEGDVLGPIPSGGGVDSQ